MPTSHSPAQNHLLAALPAAEFNHLSPNLELVPMPLGDVLYESGGHLKHVYFPTTSIVSLLYVLEDGASAEIAMVGNEGIVGISIFMGGETTPQPSRSAECGPWLSPGCATADTGIHPRRGGAPPVAALDPGADHANDADRRMQSAPFGRAATMPLVFVES